jgi:hypothetical protein
MRTAASSPAKAATRPRWRKWLLLLLLAAGLLGGGYICFAISARWEWEAAADELNRLDPRWRLEEVEADRADIPKRRNAALTVMAVKPLMPKKWPAWESVTNNPEAAALQESFTKLEPQRQLNKEQIDALRAEMERASLALPKARNLADLPEGRYPITYSADFMMTAFPHVQNVHEVTKLLVLDAMLQSQDGDTGAALTSCRAILNTGRSFGDEPLFLSQLVRIACRMIAVSALERALAQGQPAAAALRDVQQLLEKEEQEPLLLVGLRGERAGGDRYLGYIASASDPLARRAIVLSFLGMSTGLRNSQPSLIDEILSLPLYTAAGVERQRAAYLRFMTQAVEAAKLPLEQQQAEMERWEATAKAQPSLVRLMAPSLKNMTTACLRSRMTLRCAFVALATERYRLDKKNWPEKLETLREAGYLPDVPVDLFDGQPLRLCRLEDGLLIYSVGPDGEDNDGHMDRSKPLGKGTDMGFRLWDVDKRRQEAAPPKPVDAIKART